MGKSIHLTSMVGKVLFRYKDHEYCLGFKELLVIRVIDDFFLILVSLRLFIDQGQAKRISKVKDLVS